MLQNRLYSIFAEDGQKKSVTVNVVSFGYKFGIPTDADLVFDVRFLPNPFYVDDLRTMSGMDEPVKDYIFSSSSAGDFLKMLYEMVDYLLPLYAEEGKLSLNIAVGCTGGRHRSVAVAGALYDHLKKSGAKVTFTNRDMDK